MQALMAARSRVEALSPFSTSSADSCTRKSVRGLQRPLQGSGGLFWRCELVRLCVPAGCLERPCKRQITIGLSAVRDSANSRARAAFAESALHGEPHRDLMGNAPHSAESTARDEPPA